MRESEYLEGNDNLIDVLKNLPAFEKFEDDSIRKFIRFCKIQSYSKGETIIEEGHTDKSVYVLISGRVRIVKSNKLLVTLEKAGELFGEMGYVVDDPRSASVIANDDTTCLLFDGEYMERVDIEERLAFQASIYKMFSQILSYRLRITTQEYINVRQELEHIRIKRKIIPSRRE